MKKLLALVLAISTTGCASTDWLLADERHGLRPGDPCVRCGEKIIQLPNHPFEAQIRWQRGERW